MKKMVLAAMVLCFASTLVFAQETAAPVVSTSAAAMTISGVIIDNQCAGTQTPEALGDFVKTHTKQCALMPGCAASGYAIYADGKLTKFDAASNKKIEGFLKKEDSKLNVKVRVTEKDGVLSLLSIKNQE